MINKHIDLINKNFIFEKFKKDDLIKFLDLIGSRIVVIDKNEDLFVEGQVFEDMCFLLEGSIVLSKIDESGNRNIIDKIGPGNIFAEVFSMTSNKISPVTATANKKSTLMLINTNSLLRPNIDLGDDFRSSQASIISCLIKTFADKNLILMNKIEILSRRNIRDKIIHFLEKEQMISGKKIFEIQYSRKDMADFLGVDRSALSRELSRLKDDGIIDFERSMFKFL